VHLVVDVDVTTDLLDCFPAAYASALPSEEVLLQRDELPLRDAERFRCRLLLPGSQALFATEPWSPESAGGGACTVDIEPAGGRLRLRAEDGVELTLVHIGGGRFRYLGWTEMHTLLVRPPGERTAPSVTWRYREGTDVVDVPCPVVLPVG
jgi:hypothetical protein